MIDFQPQVWICWPKPWTSKHQERTDLSLVSAKQADITWLSNRRQFTLCANLKYQVKVDAVSQGKKAVWPIIKLTFQIIISSHNEPVVKPVLHNAE